MAIQLCEAVKPDIFGRLQEFGRGDENIINLVVSKYLSGLGM